MTTDRRQLSVQLVLFLSLVLVAAVSIVSLSAYRYHWVTGQLREEELQRDLELANAVALGLDSYVGRRVRLTRMVAEEMSAARLGDIRALARFVEQVHRRYISFDAVRVTDGAGAVLASSPLTDQDGTSLVGRRVDGQPWFTAAATGVAGRPYDLTFALGRSRPTMTLASSIRTPGGKLLGVLAFGLDLEELRQSVRSINPHRTDRLVVVDSQGRVIAHNSREWEAQARDLSRERVFLEAQRRAEGTTAYTSEFTGARRWAAFVRVPTTGWVVWATRGPEDEQAKLWSLIKGSILSGGLALTASALLAVVLSRLITRPVTVLAEATRDVTTNVVGPQTMLLRADSRIREFRELQAGFRHMATELRSQYQDLEAKVADRTRALEQVAREAERTSARLLAQDEIRRGYGELAALLNSLDRSQILHEATRKIAESLHAPIVAVYLRTGDPDALSLKAHMAMDTAALDQEALRPDGVPAEVHRRGEPLIVSTSPESAGVRVRTGVGDLELAVIAAFPLRYQQRAFGVLVVGLLERLTDDTRSFLENAARQLSVALSNAELFESTRYQSQQLEELNRALRDASEAKSRFLASMSHELRTPLNSILGFTEILLMSSREPLSERQRTALERVHLSGKHLLALINEVLDLAKIEAGRVEVLPERFGLSELVLECVGAIQPQADAKHLALRTVGLEGALELLQDRAKVKQILLNLLSNAVKFTPAGWVETRVLIEGEKVAVSVADSGPGIRPAEQATIFEEFRQLESPDGASADSTGLGLPISRRLATLLGGTVGVESAPGQGAVFTLRLPIRVTAGAAPAPLTRAPLEDASNTSRGTVEVLVIDDDRTVAEMVGEALASESISTAWASNATAGLAQARAERPTVILLDVMLHGDDDGWKALRELKGDPLTRGIAVVVHSAIDNPDRARQLGADAVLVKPASAAEIRAVIGRVGLPPSGRSLLGDRRTS